MRYSEDWLAKIRSTPFYERRMSWNDVYEYYHFDKAQVREEQKVVIFPEGVWMEISRHYSSDYDFIKVKAVSFNDLFFDGSDVDGTIAMGSLYHTFRIDGHSIDLDQHSEDEDDKIDRQEELLKFIYTYSHISDPRLPPVPKGILKI
ncbi:MAG: hypothetical protein IJQ67_00745 [Bacilli bacterium]|nr:hypothetical protein [Bacilli bacterium]